MKSYCLIVYGSPSGSDVIEVWGPFDGVLEAEAFGDILPSKKEGWYEVHKMLNPYVPTSRSITG